MLGEGGTMNARRVKFSRDERGATAIEYGVIAGAVALVVLTAFWTVGDSLRTGLSDIAAAIDLDKDGQSARGILFRTSPERD